MSLAACPRCWEDACRCNDGHGWMGYSRAQLEEIRESISQAIGRKREQEKRADR